MDFALRSAIFKAEVSMDTNDKLKKLRENLAQHQAASNRTLDLVLSEGGYNPSSPSAQLVNQKHADKVLCPS